MAAPTADVDGIEYAVDGHAATLTFDRPERHNALTPEMATAGARALRAAAADDAVRAVIVTGAGDEAFCAGADLGETIPEATGETPDVHPGDDDLYFRHERLDVPVIAAVNGVCVAGGMEFLQATDIRIAAESARFGLQEPRWGLSPMAGSHARLPSQIPYCEAMQFLLTGDLFSADHARQAGLVNEVVPDGEAVARAREIADSIAANSPHAVAKIKEAVQRCYNRPPGEAFRIESDVAMEVFGHEDAVEGPRAFVEDREPSFRSD
ncbi:MAG: enoyl-CoA hydratase-related protein [Haloarculaceae archaeon]